MRAWLLVSCFVSSLMLSSLSFAKLHSELNEAELAEKKAAILKAVAELFEAQNAAAPKAIPPTAAVPPDEQGRTFHAKGQCLAVTTKVLPGIPEDLQVGVLKAGGEHPGYLRLSNGKGRRKSKDPFDARGFGLKITGVKEKKLFPWEDATQDFIGINYPLFIGNNDNILPTFRAFVEAAKGPPLSLLGLLKTEHVTRRVALATQSMPPVSYLNQRYWSQAAYQFGKTYAKYSLMPCEGQPFALRLSLDDDGLKKQLQELMNDPKKKDGEQVACFRLALQKKPTDNKDYIENPQVWWAEPGYFSPLPGIVLPEYFTLDDLKAFLTDFAKAASGLEPDTVALVEEWKKTIARVEIFQDGKTKLKEIVALLPKLEPKVESPFIPAIEITAVKQDITKLQTMCEALAFNPGHSSEDIKPVGFINSLRPDVYKQQSDRRHELNGTYAFEPTGEVEADLKAFKAGLLQRKKPAAN